MGYYLPCKVVIYRDTQEFTYLGVREKEATARGTDAPRNARDWR